MSDADRLQAASVLREHAVEGRLTLEEYSARLDEVYAATGESSLAATLRELPERPTAPTAAKRRGWMVTILGSVQRRGRWTAPRRIFAFSLLGAPDLDFRQASLAGDLKVTSISLIGALTAIVPEGVDVELGGLALIGGNDILGGADHPPSPAGPRIHIRSYAVFGGARITYQSAESPEQPALAGEPERRRLGRGQ